MPICRRPTGSIQASDGYLAIAMTPIGKLADLLGIDELAPYHDQPSSWFTARDEIKKIIAARIATKTIDAWLAILEPADIWCAKVSLVERDDGQRRASRCSTCCRRSSARTMSRS